MEVLKKECDVENCKEWNFKQRNVWLKDWRMEVRYKGLNEESVSSGSSKRCTYELEMEVEKM